METLLEVAHLERPGLEPASFRLEGGECLALSGPSGAGKTLLLRALADLDPSLGRVTLEGTLREELSGPAWRRRVCYVPSESGWWSERVADHFADWPAALPLVTRLGLGAGIAERPVRELSTGERQRLALSRALVGRPRVLLLDEPTSGLDAAAAGSVEQIVAEHLAQGAGCLWVSHDPVQLERVATRRLTVQDGRVREESGA